MNFTISRKTFLAEAQAAALAAEKKPSIPVLGNLLVEAGEKNITLVGTDLDLGICTLAAAEVHEPTAFTVPAKDLIASLKAFKAETLDMSLDGDWTVLASDTETIKLPSLKAESFPELPLPGKLTSTLPSGVLREAVRHVTRCITSVEDRFLLNGALLQVGNCTLKAVATDGHRMAIFERKVPTTEPVRSVLPLRMMEVYRKLAATDGITGYAADDKHLFLVFDQKMVVCRKLSRSFPDYQVVIPKDEPRTVVTCHARELAGLLKRAWPYTNKRSRAVDLTVAPCCLVVQAETEAAKFRTTLNVKVEGDQTEFTMRFNAGYLLDFLGLVDGEILIEFRANLPGQPAAGTIRDRVAVFRPCNDPGFIGYIMPMRM